MVFIPGASNGWTLQGNTLKEYTVPEKTYIEEHYPNLVKIALNQGPVPTDPRPELQDLLTEVQRFHDEHPGDHLRHEEPEAPRETTDEAMTLLIRAQGLLNLAGTEPTHNILLEAIEVLIAAAVEITVIRSDMMQLIQHFNLHLQQ